MSRFAIVIILTVVASLVTLVASFDTVTLQRYAHASSLSYLSLEKMQTSEYLSLSRLEPLLQVIDPESESGATIFRDSSNKDIKRIIVACRGSANPKNFGTNLKFKLVPATRLSQTTPSGAMVHEGFQDASLGLWKELAKPLLSRIKEEEDATEIIFTGHSLGAANALLTSVHYRTAISSTSSLSRPCIVTFGGPKLCNDILARFIRNDALEGSTIVHLVHDKDPVLANNQKLWNDLGFQDVGIELQCDPNYPAVHTAAEEKPKSFFSSFAWNILDHCNYLGVYVGPRA
eukprot:scaffold2755_cov134-Skeletonema_marinoi.AAC.4